MTEIQDLDTTELSGRVALVTGGGRGLGRAYAYVLAKAGMLVAVVARSTDQVMETAAQISAAGGQALAVTADVSDRQAVAEAVRTVEQQLGVVNLLINNAGISTPLGPLWEVDPDEWWRSMEINVRSILLCSAAVLPNMIAHRQGRIINVASGMGTISMPYFSAYITSKTAVIRLSEVLAAETQEHGVGVFAIDPGLVRTGMSEYLVESVDGRKWLPWGSNFFVDSVDIAPEVSAQLVLRLATGYADKLSGRLIIANDDLSQTIRHVSEVEQRQLYTLRLNRFDIV
jgi:NAD(P)-dependent dehydrogenase (short-subunit alcohol dehydrogenase family)